MEDDPPLLLGFLPDLAEIAEHLAAFDLEAARFVCEAWSQGDERLRTLAAYMLQWVFEPPSAEMWKVAGRLTVDDSPNVVDQALAALSLTSDSRAPRMIARDQLRQA